MLAYTNKKVAIVYDWIDKWGGVERVLLALHELLPAATFFTSYYNPKKASWAKDLTITTSFIQKLPKAETKYKTYLPLFPLAIEQFDLSSFDVVISDSHCAAKGVIISPDQLHICYCHTPMRYAWDLMHEYLKEFGRVK